LELFGEECNAVTIKTVSKLMLDWIDLMNA